MQRVALIENEFCRADYLHLLPEQLVDRGAYGEDTLSRSVKFLTLGILMSDL